LTEIARQIAFAGAGVGKMRLIVGISGASGVLMGYEFLKALRAVAACEKHLVITEGAARNFACETNLDISQITALADCHHDNRDMAASISSGSFKTDGMVVIPCSMKTVAGIAAGLAGNLLLRAADVCLKENRRVVIVPREMPLSRIHLRNLKEAADNGCVVMPPMLTFCNGSDSVDKQINHIIGKIFMQFGIGYDKFMAWKG
jgi:4-hydroxy-3-polyprenylbenzoate decarboxylase